MAKEAKCYLVVVEGPFVSGDARDQEAKRQREKDPDGENGLFWLNITEEGCPRMGAYPAGFLDDEDDEDDEEA